MSLVASTSLNFTRNSSKEKCSFIARFTLKSNVVNQKVCKKNYLLREYDVDRNIRHSRSLFGITQQARGADR